MADIQYRLKGHESFIPREGWIAKGLREVSKNPNLFSANNFYGADDLGVGANMAKSIKYWLTVMGLMKRQQDGEHLTELGELVLENDAYIEDDFTMWLLHYHLCMNQEKCTSWYLFFQMLEGEEFTKESIYDGLAGLLEQDMKVENYSEKSLKDDVNAILSMYSVVNSYGRDIDPEENSICPFTKLGLYQKNGNRYNRTIPDYTKIHRFLILYIIVEMLKNDRSISIETVLNGIGGVARTFHCSNIALNDYLDQLGGMSYISINRTAGLDVLYLTDNTIQTSLDVARLYYGENG